MENPVEESKINGKLKKREREDIETVLSKITSSFFFCIYSREKEIGRRMIEDGN